MKQYQVIVDGIENSLSGKTISDWNLVKIDKNSFHIISPEGQSYEVSLQPKKHQNKSFILEINGISKEVNIKDDLDMLVASMGMNAINTSEEKDLIAPMPGVILDIKVQEGDQVEEGDELVVLEAMKMENVLKSKISGTIEKVYLKAGEAVDKNALILQFS